MAQLTDCPRHVCDAALELASGSKPPSGIFITGVRYCLIQPLIARRHASLTCGANPATFIVIAAIDLLPRVSQTFIDRGRTSLAGSIVPGG